MHIPSHFGASTAQTPPSRNNVTRASRLPATRFGSTRPTAAQMIAPEIIGASPVLVKVLDALRKVANTDVTVLLLGETGVGKTAFAKVLHALTAHRANGPFVPVNCGAVNENLAESEFFGHKKGAFTGAQADRTGHFVQAHGGTLFLDEVGETPLPMQAKLLSALEEGQVTPVGSSTAMAVDTRIVAATNKDLRAATKDRSFRADLYHRLKVFPIAIPALRDRHDDILPLAQHFLTQKHQALSTKLPDFKAPTQFSTEALTLLKEYHWPGNIRELKQAVESALILAQGESEIQPEHLLASLDGEFNEEPAQAESPSPARSLLQNEGPKIQLALTSGQQATVRPLAILYDEMAVEAIRLALGQTRNSKPKAAELLGISRRTLDKEIQRLGLKGTPQETHISVPMSDDVAETDDANDTPPSAHTG